MTAPEHDTTRPVPEGSDDLSAALTGHLADAQTEREEQAAAFPWVGQIADGYLRMLAVVASDLEPRIREAAAENSPHLASQYGDLLLGVEDGDVDIAGVINELSDELWETYEVSGLTQEAGEAVDAYARFRGAKRRGGEETEYLDELADLVISAFICAHLREADLASLVEAKLVKIYTRGWSA